MIFYAGEAVKWGRDDAEAEGHILDVGMTSAHVKWASGPNAGSSTLVDLYDIEPATAAKERDGDPLHFTAVRKAYDEEAEVGVLNFLASHKYLEGWTKIASDVLAYTQQRIRSDASMDLVDEQLSIPEKMRVVEASALALLRDAFSEEE